MNMMERAKIYGMSGFLSTYVVMLDSLGHRKLTSRTIASYLVG
ncbi:hypothetical protein [Anaeromonas gelatinilytica]|nr:hypothetical protein [Anaeromonas gelatinilytica]